MKKRKLGYLGLFALCGVCFVGLTSMKAPSKAVEEEVIVEVVEEPKEEEDVKAKIENFVNTYLVPLLSGVSITSVVGMLVSVVFACLNRRTNKLIKQSNKETIELSMEILKNSTNLINELNESNSISKVTRDQFVENTTALSEKVAGLTDKTEELLKMKAILITLVEVQKELAKIDPKAITSGVSQAIEKLNEQIKSLE